MTNGPVLFPGCFPVMAGADPRYNNAMRRLLIFAAFFLILSIVPMCAQRGGGHASGGHASFGGGHGVSSSHASPGFSGSHVSSYSSARSNSGFGSHTYYSRNRSGYRGPRFTGYGYGRRCLGCWYPYYGYYDPYWWGDSGSSYDDDYVRDRQIANEMNAENLDEQQRLREQDQDAYARPRADYSRSDEHAMADPATVLIFHDQHQREIQNYAIVGSTLWSFGSERTEKIPLADLDLAATTKANEDRGVDFRLPRSSEGQ